MGDLAAVVAADTTASGIPLDALVAAAVNRYPGYATNRLNYPYIAGYALSSLEQAATGVATPGELLERAATVALLLCRQDTFDAIGAEAAARAVPS